DPEEDVLRDLFRILLRVHVAEGKRVEPLPVRAVQLRERGPIPGADAIRPDAFRGGLRLVGEAVLEGHRRRPHAFRGLKRVRNPEASQDPGRPVIRTPDMPRRWPAGLRRARSALANT